MTNCLSIAAFTSLFLASQALGQGVPTPSVQAVVVLGDAGVYNTLQTDGGLVNQLSVTHITNAVTFDSNPTVQGNLSVNGGSGVSSSGFNGCGVQGMKISAVNCGEVVFDGAAGVLMDAGFATGRGPLMTSLSAGTCVLSSGICNAVTPGTGGSSHCVADITSSAQTNLGCNTIADAGATSVYCAAGATGTADVFCWN